LKKWIAKLYYMVRANGRKIIPAHRKYHERIAVNSLDPDAAEAHISSTRMNSIRLMAQREAEIEAGVEHHSPAMARDVARERMDQP
jgi:hypothetical protein